MGERLTHAPDGSERPARALDVRNFVKITLAPTNESVEITSAAVEFSTAAFYIDQGIGNPEYHIKRALKDTAKFKLSPQEIERARYLGDGLFRSFIGDLSFSSLDPEIVSSVQKAIETQEARKEENRMKQREKGIASKKQRLEERFRSVMESSDTQLRIQLSNPSIAFDRDKAYRNADVQTKARFRNRTLTEVEYNALEIISFTPRKEINIEKLIEYLHMQEPKYAATREKLGEEKFSAVSSFIERLLKGESIPRSEISAMGIDPETVYRKAWSAQRDYAQELAKKRRQLTKQIRLSGSITWKN